MLLKHVKNLASWHYGRKFYCTIRLVGDASISIFFVLLRETIKHKPCIYQSISRSAPQDLNRQQSSCEEPHLNSKVPVKFRNFNGGERRILPSVVEQKCFNTSTLSRQIRRQETACEERLRKWPPLLVPVMNVHCLVAKLFFFATSTESKQEYLILSFRRVLYVICFLLGNSPASEF